MQFGSWARGEGELYSRKAARWRDARSGGLNRKRQRTGNDFTSEGSRLIVQFYELDPSVKFAISRSKTDNPNA
jgi:hypothetical protein